MMFCETVNSWEEPKQMEQQKPIYKLRGMFPLNGTDKDAAKLHLSFVFCFFVFVFVFHVW